MNLRIQELAVEARQYAFGEVENSQDPTEWSTKYYNEMFEQKFAELIVRECVGVIHQQQRTPQGFFYAKDAHTHELAIKQHFGIGQ